MKQVGHPQQQVVELPLDCFGLGKLGLAAIRHLAQPLLQCFVASLRELLGQRVLLGLDRLGRVQVSAPLLIEGEDLVDGRGFAFQPCGMAHAVGLAPDQFQRQHQDSAFMTGKRMTSRMDGWSVSSMISRSIPTPRPPHGGRPYSTARRKSSSMG